MPFTIHEGEDYIVMLGVRDTTDKPAARFYRVGTAKKAAKLLNTFKHHPSTCSHFYVTDHTGVSQICTMCADVRA